MASFRVTYRVLGRGERVQGFDLTGAPVFAYNVSFGFPDSADEKKLHDGLVVGKDYYADFTPIEEGGKILDFGGRAEEAESESEGDA